MAQFTVTVGSLVNLPPEQIGDLRKSLVYNQLYTFTVADFTTNTVPVYKDPEGDILESIIVLTPPIIGSLTLNGVPVVDNTIITAAQINSGLLKYLAEAADIDGYEESNMAFNASDVGSSTFSSLPPGVVVFTVGLNLMNLQLLEMVLQLLIMEKH